MLKEVGRLFRTYCHDEHHKWSEYVNQAEEFINQANHESTWMTAYEAMHKIRPPRIIENLVDFTWFTQPQKDIQDIMESRLKVKAEERLSLIHI